MRKLKLLITQFTRMLQNEQRKTEAKDAEIARLLDMLSHSERDNATLREDVTRLHERAESRKGWQHRGVTPHKSNARKAWDANFCTFVLLFYQPTRLPGYG